MPPVAKRFEPNVRSSCHVASLSEVRNRLSVPAVVGVMLGLLCPAGLVAQESGPRDRPSLARGNASGDEDQMWTASSSSNGIRQAAYQESLPTDRTPQAQQPQPTAKGTPALRQPEGFWKPDSPESADRALPDEPSSSPNAEISSQTASRRVPLPRMSRSGRSEEKPADRKPGRVGGLASLLTIGGSLTLVLGLFLVVAWIMRRAVPQASVPLPAEVVEVLGRAPLAGRQQVYLLRCGKKLLLVSVTPDGAETLTEINESEEVDRLAGICRQAHPASSTGAFRQVFGQFASQSSRPGFVDENGEPTPGRARRRRSFFPGVKLEREDA